jgi:phosphatidylglycerophosphate synthase
VHQQPAGQAERERDQRYEVGRGPQGALLDEVLDRVGDAAILARLGLWALDGRAPEGVLVLTVAATTGALLSMAGGRHGATTCARAGAGVAAGRPGRARLLVAVGAVPGAPVAALAATTATSALTLGLRVAFLRRPPARDAGEWS